MTAVTPDSKIRLIKCPLRLDDNNQITFSSTSAQTTYFQSLPYIYENDMTLEEYYAVFLDK